jgi:hypothetical protein
MLSHNGTAEQSFATLAEAIKHADSGIVEIRGNGTFATGGIKRANGKPLVIRAGEGYAPVLTVSPAGPVPQFLFTNGPLVLEGLEIRHLPSEGSYNSFVVGVAQGPLRIANCRFVAGGQRVPAIDAYECARLEVRNSEFLGQWSSVISWRGPSGARAVVDNNVSIGERNRMAPMVLLGRNDAQSRDISLRFTLNTLIGQRLQADYYYCVRGSVPEGEEDAQTFRIEAAGNLFDTPRGPLRYRAKAASTEDAAAFLRRIVTWEGRQNVFAHDARFLECALVGENHALEPGLSLAQWQDFWGGADADSLQGRIVYTGGDVHAKVKSGPKSLIPADFRLHPESAGKGVGVGAEIDRVGPGEPYKRWKGTPEHQQWLVETGQRL